MEEEKRLEWREKYLDLVDRQEIQERQHQQDQEQLRRALLRVSLVADGMDSELDLVLAALRDHLKASVQKPLKNRLVVVEEALLAFEKRKAHNDERLFKSVEEICLTIQKLDVPRDVNARLKKLLRGLKSRLEKQDQHAAIFEEISALLEIALSKPDEPRKSFLTKLLGGKDSKIEEQKQSEILVTKSSNESSVQTPLDSNSTAGAKQEFIELQSEVATNNFQIDQQLLAVKVSEVLKRLLDDIEPASCVEEKINNARSRIKRGLNWRDLVPTLEDIRDLFMQSHLAANDEFGKYLLQINQQLLEIQNIAGTAAVTLSEEQKSQESFQKEIDSELTALSVHVDRATELEALKSSVNDQILKIRKVVVTPPVSQEPGQTSLSEQIKVLLEHATLLEKDAQKTRENLVEQKQKAQTDALTGLPNREAYNERSHHEYTRWLRYKNPLSMAIVDIDHFKKINDNFGHQAGDKVLQLVSKALQLRLREVDFITRYGGEEFVILLVETAKQDAIMVMNQVREAIEKTPFHFKNNPVSITVSVGISEFIDNDNIDLVFDRADQAMYEAKNNGRNQCMIK
ncbi:hypothetical protein NBRC116493_27610 [Aurantivibrio infirmus]